MYKDSDLAEMFRKLISVSPEAPQGSATVKDTLEGYGIPARDIPEIALSPTITEWKCVGNASKEAPFVLYGWSADRQDSLIILGTEKDGGKVYLAASLAWINAGVSDIPLIGGVAQKLNQDYAIRYAGFGTASERLPEDIIERMNTASSAAAANWGEAPFLYPGTDIDVNRGAVLIGWTAPGTTAPKTLTAPLIATGGDPNWQGLGDGDTSHSKPVWTDDPITTSVKVKGLALRRIGLVFDGQTFWIMVDASLSVEPLAIETAGLGLGLSLDMYATDILGNQRPAIKPGMRLDGLSLGFKEGPVEIAGGMIWESDHPGEYDMFLEGSVVVQTPAFALLALGAYTRMKETRTRPAFTSFFAFVRAESRGEVPVGIGIPPVTLNGFSAGFGYNYKLRLPDPQNVHAFPLLDAPPDGPLAALQKLTDDFSNPWASPEESAYWGILGAKATVFEKFDIWAVVPVAWEAGNISIAAIGLLNARFPQRLKNDNSNAKDPYVNIDGTFIAEYSTSTGRFAIDASLSGNSVVASQKLTMSGELSLYIWTAKEHAGEFVLSMGGYHPDFKVPTYYPQVAKRLGVAFTYSDAVRVASYCYVALTRGFYMVGVKMEICLSAKKWGAKVKLWGTASLDAVIDWSPFHIQAGVTLGAGASLDFLVIHAKVELSVSMDIWLPPFGGGVTVSLPFGHKYPLTFGALPSQKPEPLSWSQFADEHLPAPSNRLGAVAQTGLIVPTQSSPATEESPWIVSASGFMFSTTTAVPFTRLVLNADPAPPALPAPSGGLNIRPMGELGAALQSRHTVTISRGNEIVDLRNDGNEGWAVSLVQSDAPAGLWGAPLKDKPEINKPGADVIPNQNMGITVRVPGAKKSKSLPPVQADTLNLNLVDLKESNIPLRQDAPVSSPAPASSSVAISEIATEIASPGVERSRNLLQSALAGLSYNLDCKDALTHYAQRASAGLYTQQPLLV